LTVRRASRLVLAAVDHRYRTLQPPVGWIGLLGSFWRLCATERVAIKERIIDWIDDPDYKEYTYDVYETKGFPARVFNTWSVRRGSDGKTYLRNVFYFRMKPFVMTYFSVGQIRGAARGGVLGYKFFLETGRPATSPAEIDRHAASVEARTVHRPRPLSVPSPAPEAAS